MIFLWFWSIFVKIFHDFGWFFAIRICFIEADPDSADQIETDPDPKHWSVDYTAKNMCKQIEEGRKNHDFWYFSDFNC